MGRSSEWWTRRTGVRLASFPRTRESVRAHPRQLIRPEASRSLQPSFRVQGVSVGSPEKRDRVSPPKHAGDPLLPDMDTDLAQIPQQAGGAIGRVGPLVEGPQVFENDHILGGATRERPVAPRIVDTGGDPEHATHRRHREDGLVVPHEPVDPPGIVPASLANQAVASDRMSRSSFSCRFSRRSRVISVRSALVSQSARVPPSRSACATQFRIVWARGSNSRASHSGERPAWTSAISCRLNSGG